MDDQMPKRRRVPGVIWRLFQDRARTLAETMLSLIPPSSTTVQCRFKGSRHCLHCCADGDRMSFLLREGDPSDYSKLLNQCFVVVSDNAPSPPPFDPHSRWSQLEIVRRTIEMMSCEKLFAENVICTGYNKKDRSSIILEALTSASWSLLKKRVGDGLMVYLLKYSLIFVPLHRKKHHQVAGNPVDGLCWKVLKHTFESKNQQPSLERCHEVDSVSMTVDGPESSMSCLGCTVKDKPSIPKGLPVKQSSITVADHNGTGKRSRPYAWQRRRTRRKVSSQDMADANCSPEKMKLPCSCCSVWLTLQKVPKKVQISKQSILYKTGRASSILPRKHIINSLRPSVAGANALFKEVFGLSDACIGAQSSVCSHNNDICGIRTTCLYHSLHKLLKMLIRRALHCPRKSILHKHTSMDKKDNEGESSTFEHVSLLEHKDLYCSKRQVVSFIWAACRSIVPKELLGSPSNTRMLRKNISKFIRLRLYEKFSLHQCMHKLKISNFFPSLSDNHTLCNNVEVKQSLLRRWIYWFFTSFIVPLVQANFYVTESDHGKLDVFYYEKSVWEKLMKASVSCLKEKCYCLLEVNDVKRIISGRAFGFSRVRFRPKENGIRPLANLKSSSRFSKNQYFKSVNLVLRDLHAALKDVQLKLPEKLGASVFSYNDVHKKIRGFLSRVKSGSNTKHDTSAFVYMVVADVQKAYDSIDQDKLLYVMKDVITDDHLLHETCQVSVCKGHMQVCKHINLSKQFRSHLGAPSSHTLLVDLGRRRTARKDDLLLNLKEHVKYNVLNIDNRFYLQNVGIPQGSILSSLLCSFYYGHMENTKIVPFLNKVTNSSENLLLRFTDDFLFISTSKKHALAFLSRIERGFNEYNCNMNKEKFGLSFDVEKMMPQSDRAYFDEDGNKFLRWSGLFINCKTLEVQADYTRYLDVHISSTLTVRWQGNPVFHFKEKVCNYLRPKCHAIFYDSKINSPGVVRLNIFQVFLLCAMKFHCYVSDLSDICKFDSGSYFNIIHDSVRFMYKLMEKRMYSLDGDPNLRPILKVKKGEVEWLGLTAYFQVLKRKQARYKEVISLLELKLKSLVVVKRVSPALRFAAQKSNSSLLWKIKY